jgi:hypothetical protein
MRWAIYMSYACGILARTTRGAHGKGQGFLCIGRPMDIAHSSMLRSSCLRTHSLGRWMTNGRGLVWGLLGRPELEGLQLGVRLLPRFDSLTQEGRDLVGFVLANPASVPDAKGLEGRAERTYVRRRGHSTRTSAAFLCLECGKELFAKPIGSNDSEMELLQLRKHWQCINEVLVVALGIEVQHAWLQRSYLADSPIPNGGELRTAPWLIPGLVPDDERVQFGDTEVGKGVDDVVVVRELRATRGGRQPPPGARHSG